MKEILEEKHQSTLALWRRFMENGTLDEPNALPGYIIDSWKRCRAWGVDPYQKKIPVVLEGQQLREKLQCNEELIGVSRPFLENLYSFVKGSGFMGLLQDADGYLLDIIGDEDVATQVKSTNCVVGALWDEQTAGTTVTGIILKEEKPIQVCSTEHYCRLGHRVTGSGAPIHDPEGLLLGGLAIFGPSQKANPHTLGMVVAAAYAIKNCLHLQRNMRAFQVTHSFQNTVIESIPEALIALDKQGVISLINENAKRMLNLPADSSGQLLGSVLEKGNEMFLHALDNGSVLTDAEVRIMRNDKPAHYTLTCNSIPGPGDSATGKVIILNEITRAKTLVTRMMGAKAKFKFQDIIGSHPRGLEVVNLGKRAARTMSNVLLLGESGTGKDIVAQSIHNGSDRANGPFVAMNCAAIQRELIASELFGYSDGAFTGSKKGGNQGKFELADGGTICLDEIGEMPLDMQTTLLNVIEDKCIVRIGGREVVPVDVRIIATTNKNLKEEVQKKNFREDLYYRLNVFTIEMVPLRKRKSDIALLADHFAKMLSVRLGIAPVRIDEKVYGVLMKYPWPGNVRELQNVIERAVNLAPGNMITVDILPREIFGQPSLDNSNSETSLKGMERQLILDMMQSGFSKSHIAKKLSIARCTLYRKLDKHGIPH